MKKKTNLIITALIITAAIIALRYSPLADFLTLNAIQQYKQTLKSIVDARTFTSALVYSLVYAALTALSLPGAALLTLLAGYLFGMFLGLVVVNVGATLGATGAFLIVRYLLGKKLHQTYAGKLVGFNAHITEQGSSYLLSIRLLALFPFFLVNILAGLTTVSLTTFVWTTSIGILPGSLVFLYAGKQLGQIESVGEIISWPVLVAFVGLTLLSLLPAIVRKRGRKRE